MEAPNGIDLRWLYGLRSVGDSCRKTTDDCHPNERLCCHDASCLWGQLASVKVTLAPESEVAVSPSHVIPASLVTFMLLLSPAFGEQRSGETYWHWLPRGAHHASVVKVTVDEAVGTGVVVRVDRDKPAKHGYEGYVLTAAHVFDFDRKTRGIKVTYPNGRRSKDCSIRHLDKENDLALLWVWVPESSVPASMAMREATRGDALEFSGLGGGIELTALRNFEATAADPTDGQMIYADVSLLPGDSGGPIFKEGKLVGIISGGWFWWDDPRKDAGQFPQPITWPARAANLQAIQSLVGRLEGAEIGARQADVMQTSDATLTTHPRVPERRLPRKTKS